MRFPDDGSDGRGDDLPFSPVQPLINIGAGKDVTISGLAEIIREVTGFKGDMSFDSAKPDGIPRKLLDCSLLTELGWTAKISLDDGIESTYRWFLGEGTVGRMSEVRGQKTEDGRPRSEVGGRRSGKR